MCRIVCNRRDKPDRRGQLRCSLVHSDRGIRRNFRVDRKLKSIMLSGGTTSESTGTRVPQAVAETVQSMLRGSNAVSSSALVLFNCPACRLPCRSERRMECLPGVDLFLRETMTPATIPKPTCETTNQTQSMRWLTTGFTIPKNAVNQTGPYNGRDESAQQNRPAAEASGAWRHRTTRPSAT